MAPICPGGSFSHNPAISHHISAWALKGTFKLQLSPGALLRPMEKGYLMLPILSPNPSPRWVTGSPFPALGVRTIQWVAVFLGLALLLCFEGALGLIQRSWGWCHLLQLANYLTLLPQSEEQGTNWGRSAVQQSSGRLLELPGPTAWLCNLQLTWSRQEFYTLCLSVLTYKKGDKNNMSNLAIYTLGYECMFTEVLN